jgi:hypothetical protein
MFLEYTTFIKGVDIANQLRASYSSQSRSHKMVAPGLLGFVGHYEGEYYIINVFGLMQTRTNPVRYLIPVTTFRSEMVLLSTYIDSTSIYRVL